jgi:hypothetical protein
LDQWTCLGTPRHLVASQSRVALIRGIPFLSSVSSILLSQGNTETLMPLVMLISWKEGFSALVTLEALVIG